MRYPDDWGLLVFYKSRWVDRRRRRWVEINRRSPVTQRTAGRLEHLHDAKAGQAIVERRLALVDAFHEITQLLAQSFGRLQMRRPHVTRTIVDKQVVHTL